MPLGMISRGGEKVLHHNLDLGFGEHAAAEQDGNLLGANFVVLGLAAMDGLHIQRRPEHKRNPFASTQVSQPGPR
jgi:hypothetical protein